MTSSDPQPLDLKSTLSSLPPPYPSSRPLRSLIRDRLRQTTPPVPILVALDDDPTGTQTCHNIPVLTVWDVPTLTSEFHNTAHGSGFFILTNSRALHTAEARDLIGTICRNLQAASENAGGKEFEVVLRGDSTLRGHFPAEPQVVDEVLGKRELWLLAPFFLQGGRYTIGNVHYVAEGDKLIPAGQTPFAKDATFGYKSSDLREWVVEKIKGEITQERVVGISLEDIRQGGPEKVSEKLMGFEKGSVVILNAASEEDMDVSVLGILDAESKGRTFLFRTGAAFVSTRLGIDPIPPLSAHDLKIDADKSGQGLKGGLIIAGSYVPKTTRQLEVLIEKRGDRLTQVVLDVESLLEGKKASSQAIREAINIADARLAQGHDVLVMTSRKLVTGKNEKESLNIGTTVAKSLLDFANGLGTRPRYVIAKVSQRYPSVRVYP